MFDKHNKLEHDLYKIPDLPEIHFTRLIMAINIMYPKQEQVVVKEQSQIHFH